MTSDHTAFPPGPAQRPREGLAGHGDLAGHADLAGHPDLADPAEQAAVPASCTVVVPVRDDEGELDGLLRALAAQTLPPHEVIVVDNGSRDGSAALARSAGCTVLCEPRPGIAAAATTGYDAARGEVIVRCDADTRPPPEWVAAHERAHRLAGPSAVIVTGPGHFSLPGPFGSLASVLYLGGYVLATGAALGHLPAFGTTMSMRSRWWREVRDEASRSGEVHDDMDLSFRVRPGERVLFSASTGVEMSPRALRPGRGTVVRWRRALATLRRNWRMQTPWDRWAARLTTRPPRAPRRPPAPARPPGLLDGRPGGRVGGRIGGRPGRVREQDR